MSSEAPPDDGSRLRLRLGFLPRSMVPSGRSRSLSLRILSWIWRSVLPGSARIAASRNSGVTRVDASIRVSSQSKYRRSTSGSVQRTRWRPGPRRSAELKPAEPPRRMMRMRPRDEAANFLALVPSPAESKSQLGSSASSSPAPPPDESSERPEDDLRRGGAPSETRSDCTAGGAHAEETIAGPRELGTAKPPEAAARAESSTTCGPLYATRAGAPGNGIRGSGMPRTTPVVVGCWKVGLEAGRREADVVAALPPARGVTRRRPSALLSKVPSDASMTRMIESVLAR
eukprot:Amastigsp_a343952_63.p3 type:complete len:287 gc:universal Amastigsp_a343952_63:1103-243(-)